jgi:aryl-alcohol dehydrogenase-like predicted oxidoreductase
MKLFKHGFSRRQFLKTSGVASLMYSLAPGFAAAAESAIIKKTIPSSGERLSVIGLGTSRTFDVDSDNAVTSQLMEVMQAFFDNDGQLIDSSPMYGSAEAVTGALVKQAKNKRGIFTATKVWTNGRGEGIEQMERSMQRLGVEQIDLMQIHNLRDWQTHIDTLIDWKAEGRIRYIGITTSHGRYHRTGGNTATTTAGFRTVQLQHPQSDCGTALAADCPGKRYRDPDQSSLSTRQPVS